VQEEADEQLGDEETKRPAQLQICMSISNTGDDEFSFQARPPCTLSFLFRLFYLRTTPMLLPAACVLVAVSTCMHTCIKKLFPICMKNFNA
jgi:hypothetical protein